MDKVCRSGLTGTFCRQCNQSAFYYVAAEQGSAARCEPCENVISNGFSSIIAIVLVVLGVLLLACAGLSRCVRGERVATLRGMASLAVQEYTVLNKLKLLVGFVEYAGLRTLGPKL